MANCCNGNNYWFQLRQQYFGINQGGGGGGYNPLTTAWIAATGETDLTILTALNNFEQGMIDYNLTSKMTALYPFVGGDATKHKYNFIDTALYELPFSGGWTHSSSGALPNGTNAYAETTIDNTIVDKNNLGFFFYSNTDRGSAAIPSMGIEFGGGSYTANYPCLGGLIYTSIAGSGAWINLSSTDTLGLFGVSRLSSSSQKAFKNSTLSSLSTDASVTIPSGNYFTIGGNVQAGVYDSFRFAMAGITLGLTDTEVGNMYTIIQAFQTALSRNV